MTANIKLLLCSSALISSLVAGNAYAQDDEDEIIVTARKISESIQDIPVSVTAFNEDLLEERGLDGLDEIARNTPGFVFEDFNGAFGTPTVRGQSQNRLTNPVQNVSTFYNGVYIQRGYMVDQSLLNIGQVEILKGPQSAALGRNAFAGAVSYRTKEPGDEFEGQASISYGEDDYLSYDISGSIPIEGFMAITAGYSQGEYDGGWENNHALADAEGGITEGNLGGYDSEAYSLGVHFTPADNFEIRANYLRNDRTIENPGQFSVLSSSFDSASLANPFGTVDVMNCSTAPNGSNGLFCGELPTSPIIAAGSTRTAGLVVDPRSGLTIDSEIISVGIDYDINEKWGLSYLYGSVEGQFRGAGSPNYDPELGYLLFAFPAIVPLVGIDLTGNGGLESDSHEFRVNFNPSSDIQGYVGYYTSDAEDTALSPADGFQLLPAQTTGPLVPLTFPSNGTFGVTDNDVESIFAFVEYDAGDFSLSAEGRYTEEKITDGIDTVELDYFTPRVTASYNWTDNNRVYASYAKGTKAGGLNPGTFFDPEQRFYDEEENSTFEIGSRNELMDGDVIFNVSAFYIDAKNLQVSEAQTLPPGSMIIPPSVVGNLGAAETLGFELETNWSVSDALDIYGSVGYADAEYSDGIIDQRIVSLGLCDDVVCNANGDIGGNDLARAPKLNANAGFFYEGDVSEDFQFFIGGNASYQSKQFVGSTNTTEIAARTIVDSSIGVRSNGIELKIAADNLLDEQYVSSAFQVFLGSSPFFFSRNLTTNLGDRRKVYAKLSYKY